MPASLVPNGRQYFADINGAPLVGGSVAMYVPLTLTPANTWEDSAQTILNTNPIILDSRGQATIYGTGSYRQIVSDSLGNVIYDAEIAAFQESVFGAQVVLASATTTDLGAASSNNILISGVTTINSFGTSASLANPIYLLQFGGILQLTYNATSLILPGAANITTAAGDSALVEVTNAVSGYWRVFAYFSGATGGSNGTAAAQNIGTSGANVPLLNGNNTWSGSNSFIKQTYSPPITLIPVGGAVTPDFSTGNNFVITITANLMINNPLSPQLGQSGVIAILENNAGLSLSWGTSWKAPGGIGGVTLSGVNAATDHYAFYVNNGTFIVVTPLLNAT